MRRTTGAVLAVWLGLACLATAAERADWWNAAWRFRTTVDRPTPYRDAARRPVEAAIDFTALLAGAGENGPFDPASLRVVARDDTGARQVLSAAWRAEVDAIGNGARHYLTWFAEPEIGSVGPHEIYFDTVGRDCGQLLQAEGLLPPENLVENAGFESADEGLPRAWRVAPRQLARLGHFAASSGRQSLQVVVDGSTPDDADRTAEISQEIDVRRYAGQEMVFQCDLLAERAAYGAPLSIELEQYRSDGSRIMEYAIEPRWLTLELAEGQLVRFDQRGRFSPEAARLKLRISIACSVRDEDTGRRVDGPESYYRVWLDRVVVRPGERWPWPVASGGGFVAGALEQAPLNRGFQFTGVRRLAFNGASEGTLTSGRQDPDPRSNHWGVLAGTLEFWFCPSWNADDGREHCFFEGIAYGHRLQSRLRKLDARGGNRLEFSIADSAGRLHTVGGSAPLVAGQWRHIAATWNFAEARLQLFVEGQLVAAEGPGSPPWPASLLAEGDASLVGMGIGEDDRRSLPMQAFIGGDQECGPGTSAEGVFDDLRISDVARYSGSFTPSRREQAIDAHTRALFHFENETNGVHGGDDQFVDGHLACELSRHADTAQVESLVEGKIAAHEVAIRTPASNELFEQNRAESRLTVTRPHAALPDPRFIEYRPRQIERVMTSAGEQFAVEVAGDYPPIGQSITYTHADPAAAQTTPLAHWRANDNVVPLSVKDLAATLAPQAGSDEERALAAFRYALATTNYYDASYCETLPEMHRPRVSYTLIKALNIYPFDQCGPLNHTLRKLFLSVGISSNDASGTHHQFEQAYFNGDFRLFDLSPRKYWLERDNTSIAGRRDFEEDLYLKIRQGDGVTSGLPGRVGRARYGSAVRPHSMEFRLRAGETAAFNWHNEGRWFELTEDRQPIHLAKIPPSFGNGAIVFRPQENSQAIQLRNLRVDAAPDGSAVLRPQDPARVAEMIYSMECPYIFSAARMTGSYSGAQRAAVGLAVSFDRGQTWAEIWRAHDAQGAMDVDFGKEMMARYAAWLKLSIAANSSAEVAGPQVRSTFVASPLALPGKLSLGSNRIRPAGGPAESPLRTTCRWLERHRSDLGVSLNATSFYLDGDQTHRKLLIAAPGEPVTLRVLLEGRRFGGIASLDGLPDGWTYCPVSAESAAAIAFTVHPPRAEAGQIEAFDVLLDEQGRQRRVSVEVLLCKAPLVCEAEDAAEIAGAARTVPAPELSGAAAVAFGREKSASPLQEAADDKAAGRLAFEFSVDQGGNHALWLRARWTEGSSTSMSLGIDEGPSRSLRAAAMIGFTDWSDPNRAHTKMFAHFGEQYAHWSWYRVGDIKLPAGRHRLTLSAAEGAEFDALLLLPQTQAIDRAAMNLLQNWNFAPWQNAL